MGRKKDSVLERGGVGKKDEEFWKYVSNCDFVGLVEMWVDGKGWEQIKGWLPS